MVDNRMGLTPLSCENGQTRYQTPCGSIICYPKNTVNGSLEAYYTHRTQCPACTAYWDNAVEAIHQANEIIGYTPVTIPVMSEQYDDYGCYHNESTVRAIRRYQQSTIKTPIFPTEDEAYAHIGDNCRHSWVWNSHEEQRCTKCGCFKLVPDSEPETPDG
jgi:hypothetical protein